MTRTLYPLSRDELETKTQLRRADLLNLEEAVASGQITPDVGAVRVAALTAVLVSLDKERKRRAKYPS